MSISEECIKLVKQLLKDEIDTETLIMRAKILDPKILTPDKYYEDHKREETK